jgi:hypothetical protein
MKRLQTMVALALALAVACQAEAAGKKGQKKAKPASRDGWEVLFDGKDLSAWMDRSGGPAPAWVIEDGAVVRKEKVGDLWSKKRYGDFILDLEFKTEGNSGVFIRTDDPKNNVQTGIEIQVINAAKEPSRHSCGAIYDALAPTKDVTKDGQWNHMTVTAKDNKIEVVMNGEKIIDMDLNQWTEPNKNPDGTPNKFKTALKDFKREGHIGLQDHGAVVAYRNIRVKAL